MPNMSYCRMENTYRDLRDCAENWDDCNSKSEVKYRKRILTLCREIIVDHGEEDEEDE